MNQLDRHFHRAQARLKSNALKASFKGQNAVAPSFYVPLAGLEPVTDEDRRHEYAAKKAALNACRFDMDRMSAVRSKVMRRIEMNRMDERKPKREAA